MTAPKLFLQHTLFILALCGAFLFPAARAQDEASGNDDGADDAGQEAEVFMSSDNKEEFMEYRLHDESEKGLQDYYIDYGTDLKNLKSNRYK